PGGWPGGVPDWPRWSDAGKGSSGGSEHCCPYQARVSRRVVRRCSTVRPRLIPRRVVRRRVDPRRVDPRRVVRRRAAGFRRVGLPVVCPGRGRVVAPAVAVALVAAVVAPAMAPVAVVARAVPFGWAVGRWGHWVWRGRRGRAVVLRACSAPGVPPVAPPRDVAEC